VTSKLALKLAENRERREKEALMNQLPGEWRTMLAEANTYPSWVFLQNFPVDASLDLRNQPWLRGKLTNYIDTDDLQLLSRHLKEMDFILRPPFSCWLGSGPAFLLEESLAFSCVSELVTQATNRIYLAESEYSRGAMVDEYVGYLDKERMTNNRELVYEVLTFE
jgi:hypothetical protein